MLKKEDYNNLLAIMQRVQYNGLGEAEAASVLAFRIRAELADLDRPPQGTTKDGAAVQNDSE